jgi:acetyltransferase
MTGVATIELLDARALAGARAALIDLLIDIVEHGASVGFLLPLTRDIAGAYWDDVAAAMHDGSRCVWIARRNGRIVGSVQLDLVLKPNGLNRAEVQKLIVHSTERRGGVGRQLMAALEHAAGKLERGVLFLDTEAGSGAEPFYRSLGYVHIGGIPEYACSPQGEWCANAIYFKTLFSRNGRSRSSA